MAFIDPQRLPLFVAAVATLLLAVTLAAIDFEKRVNRAFALFLALRAVPLGLLQLDLGTSGNLAITAFTPYLTLGLVPAALYFASLYPRRRGPLAGRFGGWITLGIVLVLDLLYFLRHDLYYTVEPGFAANPALIARQGLQYTAFGPLNVVAVSAFPVLASLSLLFVRDYVRSPPGAQRTSYFLVAAGFLVNGLFDGSSRAVSLFNLLRSGAEYPWAPWGWAVAGLPALALFPAAAALVLVARHHFSDRDDEHRRENLLYALSALAILTGLSPFLLPASSGFFEHPATIILLGLWRLTLPLFVSYALLRYALFDIDLKVRAAVAGSVVVIFGAAGYFLVSELLEGQVASRFGNLGGLAAAAIFTLVAGPLGGAGKKVARFVMPGVYEPKGAPTNAALDLYRQQYLMLQEDGALTPKERASLDGLRGHLGLTLLQTKTIERSARPA